MVKQRLENQRFAFVLLLRHTGTMCPRCNRRAKRDSDQVLTFDPASRRAK